MAEARRNLALLLASSMLSVYLVAVGFYLAAIFVEAAQQPRAIALAFVLLVVTSAFFVPSLGPLYPQLRIAGGHAAWPAHRPWVRVAEYLLGLTFIMLTVLFAIFLAGWFWLFDLLVGLLGLAFTLHAVNAP